MIQERATILWNRPKGPACYSMGLSCNGYAHAVPGQFVMLRISDQHAPLLRRPFSIHRLILEKDNCVGIELLYKVVGTGTALLAAATQGRLLDILGPIGNGFRLSGDYRRVYLVGGGIGVPPLVFLAEKLVQSGVMPPACRMFLGGRSREDLLCIADFERLGIAVQITTDDGSAGDQCLVTSPLETAVVKAPPDVIFACGPPAMLSCIVGISEKHGVACQVSIESMMACGIGACLGCAARKRDDPDHYWHVCKDGPVFDATQVIL